MNDFYQNDVVGISITSFNYSNYIGDAVQSVVNQTSPNWKLFIYDNMSTDNTLEVLEPYLKDDRISLVVHESNIGAKENTIFAVRNMSTKYSCLLQADDFLEENFVEETLSRFKQYPSCPFVFFNWHQYMDDTKKRLFHNRFPFDKNRSGVVRTSPFLTVCNFVPLHMVSFNTEILKDMFEVLLKSPLHQVGEQYLLKLIEDQYGYGCYSGTLGGVWRRHGQQLTALQMDSGVAWIEEPIERHWYATMAPNPNKDNVFMALLNFVRLCSRVNYFVAAKWLMSGEGIRYAESFNLPVSDPEQKKRLQGIALTVAVKYTAYSMMNLCSSDEIKDWLQFMGYSATKNGLKRALENVRQSEGDSLINQEEINTVCNRFFPLDDRAKAYHEWRKMRVLTEADGQLFAERLQNSLKPNFLLITLQESNNTEHLADLIESLGQQFYSQWSLAVISTIPCPDPLFDELDMLHWINAEKDVFTTLQQVLANVNVFDWVAVLPEGVCLASQALVVATHYINLHPEWSFIYSDEDSLDANGSHIEPQFKPDFNLDFLRSTDYIGNFCLIKKSVLDELGGYCQLAGVLNWDMALRVFDALGSTAMGHIPDVLLHQSARILTDIEQRYLFVAGKHLLEQHLKRNEISADVTEGLVPGTYYIDYPLTEFPSVAVIITVTFDAQLKNLPVCVESLITKIAYQNYKLVIISTLSEQKIRNELSDIDTGIIDICYFSCPASYKSLFQSIEFLAQIDADFFWFFSVDLKVVQDQCLERMLAHASRSEVGIVSARIVTNAKTLHHAGMILGMGDLGIAGYPHKDLPIDDPGYMNRAAAVQNFSVVSEQCLLVKANLFKEIVAQQLIDTSVFGFVEFCLQVTQRHLLIVWTPFVTFLLENPILQACEMDELRNDADVMLAKHLKALAHDKAYSRHLSLKHRHYQIELETDVTWNPDFHDKLRIFAFPANASGVGEYRVRSPLRALTKAGAIQSSLLPDHVKTLVPDVVEIERAQPDVLLLQNGTANYLIYAWQQYKKFNHVFRIYSQDDLVSALPQKHPLRKSWPKDMGKRVRKLVSNSDRLIVATEPLLQEYGKWVDDVRLVPNYLERSRWTELSFNKKERSGKLRVGWAGGAQHQGDLEFIFPVIEATKEEVDWIFMGMCPDQLKPLIKEYHGGVPFDVYPENLARLNLDLAIAPLEYNNFNMAKTNLRILEYGVLGWPVICSDIFPYQNAPVTRVVNNVNQWVKAIREKINEPDALCKEGLELKQWVMDNFMLEDHLDEWLSALTP